MSTHHVLLWSGGKDSSCTILLFLEHYIEIVMPGDLVSVVFAEVMYCNKRGISAHSPQIMSFVTAKAEELQNSYGINVQIVHSEKDFLSIFHHRVNNPREHMGHIGLKYGFPSSERCHIGRDCKIKPLNDWIKEQKKMHPNFTVVKYLGIAADEKDRLESMHLDGGVSLLERYGYTEQMAYNTCKSNGWLSPQYSLGRKQLSSELAEKWNLDSFTDNGCVQRDGCFFCDNCGLIEHYNLKKCMPDVWDEYVSLECESDLIYRRWNTRTTETLHERDALLDQLEDIPRQMNFFDFLQ